MTISHGRSLYNPVSAAFTSTDPVYGGNTTAYAYPQDPVNGYDLDGRTFNERTYVIPLESIASVEPQ